MADTQSIRFSTPLAARQIPARFTPSELPVISPAFAAAMEECCSQALYDWLRTNAPDAVVRLAHACGTMRTYCSESNECDGKVSPDFNESILEVIATAVNAMGQLGVELKVVSR